MKSYLSDLSLYAINCLLDFLKFPILLFASLDGNFGVPEILAEAILC